MVFVRFLTTQAKKRRNARKKCTKYRNYLIYLDSIWMETPGIPSCFVFDLALYMSREELIWEVAMVFSDVTLPPLSVGASFSLALEECLNISKCLTWII